MAKLFFFGPLSDVREVESMTVPLPAELNTIEDLAVALHQLAALSPCWQNANHRQSAIL